MGELSRTGPKGYEHGWVFVGVPGGSAVEQAQHAEREIGPRVGKESLRKTPGELADLIEQRGHANFDEHSPMTGRAVAELKSRGVDARTQNVKALGERRVHVFDASQRRPAGENGPPGEGHAVLPGRARKVADQIMADMGSVSSPFSGFSEADLRGAESELLARLHAGTGDPAAIRLRLRAIRAFLRKSGGRPVQRSAFAEQWTAGWTSSAQRFNHNHGAAGSGHGGQFVSAGGGGSGAAKTAKPKLTAHQAHVAHVAHERHIASHPGDGNRAQAKRLLLEKAQADRAQAKKLQIELHGLEQQEKAAQIAAKKSAAAAKPGHAAHVAAAKKAAAHRKTAAHHASLKQRISALQTQISGLLSAAKALDAQAAALLWTPAARCGWAARSRTRPGLSGCTSTGCTARARRRSRGARRVTSTGAWPNSASTSATRRVTATSLITRRWASTRRRTPRWNTQEGR